MEFGSSKQGYALMFENYDFRIIKEDRKSLSAGVYPDFRIIIKAPIQAKDFEIDNFIKRKNCIGDGAAWVNCISYIQTQQWGKAQIKCESKIRPGL